MQLNAPPPDSIRATVDRVFENPLYGWAVVKDPWRVVREWLDQFLEWLRRVSEAHPVGRVVLLAVAITVLVVILVHLGYVVWRVTRGRGESGLARETAGTVRRDEVWYLEASRTLASQGRYAEAIAYRFTALVLQLERRRAVRYHPSKTPAEYVREVRLPDAERAGLASLTSRLYGHVFGGLPCTEADWRRFDENAGAIA